MLQQWIPQSSRIVLAASNSTSAARRRADVVCSDVNAAPQIQAKINAIATSGGEIILEDGLYPALEQLTISNSNVRIRGRSRDVILKPFWNVATPGSSLQYVLRAVGTDLSRLYNVSVANLTVISEAPWTPVAEGGVVGQVHGTCYFQYCEGLKVENLHGERLGFLVDIRTSNNIDLNHLSATQCAGPVALVTVNDLSIIGVIADEVKAVVDLALVNNATITNIRGTGTVVGDPAFVHAFDAGGCSNVTVSDFDLSGFHYVFNLKHEGSKTTDIAISNGHIANCTDAIRLDRVGQTTGPRMGPLKANNIGIKNCSGVGINLLGYSTGDIISNCNISAAFGISAIGTTDTLIHDCIINATAGYGIRAGKLGSGLESYRPHIHNNTIAAADASHGGGNSALSLSESFEPNIHHNTITASGYHGIWALQCKGGRVCDNQVLSAWGNGIVAQWQNTAYTDATARSLDFELDRNAIQGWYNNGVAGLSGASKAIHLDLTGITGAAYNDMSISGNRIVGPTGGVIAIDLNSPVDLNNFSIVDNKIRGITTNKIYRRGAGVLGAGSIVRRNIGHVTENSGTATIAAGATTAVVTHGLASNANTAAPTAKDFAVTPTSNLGNATRYWISAVTATTFTITLDVAPGGAGATFAWQAVKLFGV